MLAIAGCGVVLKAEGRRQSRRHVRRYIAEGACSDLGKASLRIPTFVSVICSGPTSGAQVASCGRAGISQLVTR